MSRVVALAAALGLGACTAAPLDAGTTGAAAMGPTTRATLAATVDALAMDATDVYFTAEDGFLYRVARTGTSPPVHIAEAVLPGSSYTGSIALDTTYVYWTAFGDGVSTGGVLAVPKSGGSPVPLASGRARPLGLAVDDLSVYWADEGPPPPDQTNLAGGGPAIARVAKTGGLVTILASDVDAPDALALDPTGVIWHERLAIRRVPKAGGAAVFLAQESIAWNSSNLVVDGSDLYWAADVGVWSLRSVALAGGAVSTLVPSIDGPGGLLVLGPEATWIVAHGTGVGTLESAPVTGGAAAPLSSADVQPGTGEGARLLVGDATSFYWVETWETAGGLSVVLRTLPRAM